MAKRAEKQSARFLAIPLLLVLVDLAFQKGAADPLNPIKFWILGSISLWLFSSWISLKQKMFKSFKYYYLIIGAFALFMTIAYLATDEKAIGLIGDTGRNIGLLNYLFLIFVAIYSTLNFNFRNVNSLYVTAAGLSGVLTTYGIFQHFNKDFLPWKNQYNPIILMTGNPDFAASLLGLLLVICFAGLFMHLTRTFKFLLFVLITIAILVIFWTHAWQGLIGSAIGIGFIVFIWLGQRNKKFAFGLLGVEILVGLIAIMGMLQMGPLSKYLYKISITDRGYNWRAAIEMVKHHPFTGVGLDRYSAYFLQYRDPKYPLLFGYNQTVTNAHNVFLEIFGTAGIFAGVAYLALIIFIGFCAFKSIRSRTGKERLIVSGIVAGWLVFIAQSFISVDSVVLSVWGWVLGGAIVALSKNKSESSFEIQNGFTFARGATFSVLIIGFLFVLVPMYRNETGIARFQIIQNPTDPAGQNLYREIARKTFNGQLLNSNYKVAVALKMAENNYAPEAINYFKETIKSDPRNSNAYSYLAVIYEKLNKVYEAIVVRNELMKLDPYGAENIYKLANDYLTVGDKESAVKLKNSIISMAPGTDVASSAEKLIAQ